MNMDSSRILELAEFDSDSRLHAVLRSGLKKMLGEKAGISQVLPLWSAEYFGLDQVQIFQLASPQQQTLILRMASQALLEEALYIEKSGMAYSAKMSLLAETVEERMLYGLFAADETLHYYQVRQFLPAPDSLAAPNEFHRLLADIIQEGSRESLVLIIQVVLEGWGLIHYKSLAKGCQSPQFVEVLSGILRDEARHHGSGVSLCRARALSQMDQKYVQQVLIAFLHMVQLGPQSLLSTVDHVTGGLSRAQKIQVFEELSGAPESQKKLDILKRLLQENVPLIANALEIQGCFSALSAEDCI